MQGVQGNIKFSYRVEVEEHTCGNVNTLNWIELGRTSSGISIPVGDFAVRRINFRVPVGSPLCTVRYSLEVQANNEIYANDYFDVRVKAR